MTANPAALEQQLGLDLQAGDHHYRAFVGPPAKYDLVSAMQFNLLTFLGLREFHYLLDLGCGSLRAGRLLIPYLLPEHYLGIEPEQWLVDEGIKNELGQEIIEIKKPQFLFRSDFKAGLFNQEIDFAIAQSVFSHAGAGQIKICLQEVSTCLAAQGILAATFIRGNKDYTGGEWVYPGCVQYTAQGMKSLAGEAGLGFRIIDWPHPNGQTWAIFGDSGYIKSIQDPTYLLGGKLKRLWKTILKMARSFS